MADKIVSWGGIDSKGTSGMGVTGSLSLIGNLNFQAGATRYISISAPPTSGNGSNLVIQGGNGNTEGTGGNIYLYPGAGAGGPGPGRTYIGNEYGWDGLYVTGLLTVTEQGPNTGTAFTVNAGGSLAMRYDWDNINSVTSAVSANRILRFTGASQYQVRGSGTTSSTTALLVQNANASASLSVLDNGYVGIGTSSPTTQLEVFSGSAGGTVKVSNSTYYSYWTQGSSYTTTLALSANGAITWGNGASFNFASTGDTTLYRIDNGTFVTNNNNAGFYAGRDGYLGFSTYSTTSTFNAIGATFADNNTVSLKFFYKSGSVDTEGIRLTNTGLVGIGTATPTYNLEVSSTSGTGFGIMSGANNGAEINFQNRGYALPRWTIRATGAADGSSGGLTFQRLASTFPVSITADENLLVGTTLDSARLTVKGSGTTSSTTALLVQNANASASLSVLDNGYVGIGTNAPAQALDVNGTFRIAQPSTANAFTFAVSATTVLISNGGQGTFSVLGNNSTINAGNGGYPEYRLNSRIALKEQDTTFMSIANGYSALQFSVGNTERARLFSTGNWGINTTTDAGFKLDVSGSGRFTSGLTVTGSLAVTGSALIGGNTTSSSENTLTLGLPSGGGAGEGGQLGLNATGGSYTSASFIDVYQDQFRVLKGTNAGSVSGLMVINMPTNQTQFLGPVTASAYSGLPNDYLYATRSGSNQTVGSAWANTDIIFNNVVVSKGISFNTSTGVASLTGGKVYRVTARLAWSAAAAYNLQFSCYTSANTKIGPDVEIVQSANGTFNISDGTLEFIYAPSGNTDIKIRCTGNNTALSGEQIRYDLNTQFIIQQIA